MSPPPPPPDEEERLEALARYAVLDTPGEANFDRITDMVARIFDAPVSLISLVDRDRQWFKSHHGIGAQQSPRDEAFCAYTILDDQLMIVPDAVCDPRFIDNPLVTGPPHFRSYAGAPLVTPDGRRIGTICVFDYKPREFSPAQIPLLADFAAIVIDELEGRLARDGAHPAPEGLREAQARERERTAELAEANERLHQEIAYREHAEAAVRRSESKFRALLENTQDLISITDGECVILYNSPSVEHMLGYKADELLGRQTFDYIHPDDHPALRGAMDRILREGAAYVRCEYRFRSRDGSWRHLESVASSTPPDSPILGLVINSRDLTERKRAESNLEAHARQQEATAELGRRALHGPALGEMFDAASALVTRTLRIELCSINELLPGGEKLLIRAGDGWPPGIIGRTEVNSWRGRMTFDVAKPDPLVIEDLRVMTQFQVLPPDFLSQLTHAPVSAASVLIQAGGQPFGTLTALSREPGRFSRQDVTFLQTVADLLSTVIERQRNETALRQAEARFQRIVANTPGMVYRFALRVDGSMDFPFASEGCRDIFGVDPATLYENPQAVLGLIHPEEQRRFYESISRSAALLQPWHWEGRIVLPWGEQKWIQGASRTDLQPNGDILWDGILVDITRRRQAEEALRAAKEEAERANNVKSEFLSRMSHELRTPLNAILGFGQLLEISDLGERHNQSVTHILEGGRRLLGLVDEVLDMARIEAGGLELDIQAVRIDQPLEKAIQLLTPLADQRQVLFDPLPSTCQRMVMADPERLDQILLNLLSNAVKFNTQGGNVRFSCRSLPEEGRVRLTITDRGSGLSDTDRERFFNLFEKLDAPQTGIEGVGIGLAVAKQLIEAMGGCIGVKSSADRGSAFFIELPAAPETMAAASTQEMRNVLCIEDNKVNTMLLERLIERRPGLRLRKAEDGLGGVAMALEEPPDLILLDLHLPDINGVEVLRRLRADERTLQTPVLVVSADAIGASIGQLRQLGVRDYLTKPLDAETFLRAVDQALDPAPL
jgi:PAS domain S-box-containing protein